MTRHGISSIHGLFSSPLPPVYHYFAAPSSALRPQERHPLFSIHPLHCKYSILRSGSLTYSLLHIICFLSIYCTFAAHLSILRSGLFNTFPSTYHLLLPTHLSYLRCLHLHTQERVIKHIPFYISSATSILPSQPTSPYSGVGYLTHSLLHIICYFLSIYPTFTAHISVLRSGFFDIPLPSSYHSLPSLFLIFAAPKIYIFRSGFSQHIPFYISSATLQDTF